MLGVPFQLRIYILPAAFWNNTERLKKDKNHKNIKILM
jgi:hypothetical protein